MELKKMKVEEIVRAETTMARIFPILRDMPRGFHVHEIVLNPHPGTITAHGYYGERTMRLDFPTRKKEENLSARVEVFLADLPCDIPPAFIECVRDTIDVSGVHVVGRGSYFAMAMDFEDVEKTGELKSSFECIMKNKDILKKILQENLQELLGDSNFIIREDDEMLKILNLTDLFGTKPEIMN